MKTEIFGKCIICGKKVKQRRATSVPRQTCPRTRINGKTVKSACELEKSRRYQENYRNTVAKAKREGKPKPPTKNNSVAFTDKTHLKNHQKAEKVKRECLKCEKKFTANGRFNRFCENCTVLNNRIKHYKF